MTLSILLRVVVISHALNVLLELVASGEPKPHAFLSRHKWWAFFFFFSQNRRRQARLQKELAEAAKEPLPVEQ